MPLPQHHRRRRLPGSRRHDNTGRNQPATNAPSEGPATGSGSSTDFCQFISGIDSSSFDFGLDPDGFKAAMEDTLRGIQRALDLAPPEVKEDVAFVLASLTDFVELLEEYEYNLIALGTVAAEDPRLLAFDEAAYTDAGERIGNFCGVDLSGDDDPAPPPVVGPGGGGTVPDLLVPPDVAQTLDVGNGSAIFTSTAPFDELVTFYTDALGSPLFADNTQRTALWNASVDGAMFTVGLAGEGGNVAVLPTFLG